MGAQRVVLSGMLNEPSQMHCRIQEREQCKKYNKLQNEEKVPVTSDGTYQWNHYSIT